MTKSQKISIKRDKLSFGEHLKNDLQIVLKFNSHYIGDEFIVFVPSILTKDKGEWSVFNYRGNIKKDDLSNRKNQIIWDYRNTILNILNDNLTPMLEMYSKMEVLEQKKWKFNLKIWRAIGAIDKRKEKVMRVLNLI